MRITKNFLHKAALDTVKQRTRSEPDLHAAYLTGSLLSDDPLLGGTTDIDLVLVHKFLAPVARETLALTPEVSLDILHKTTSDFEPARQLRQNALIGYPLTFYHIILYDSDHWLEFIQSTVSAEFHRADHVLARVNPLLHSAREIWRTLNEQPPEKYLDWLDLYLDALSLSTNALAGLIGPPLTTRRFMITLDQRLQDLGTPDIYAALFGLLGCSEEIEIKHKAWIDAFEGDLAYLSNTTDAPPHLGACRQAYYVSSIKSLAHGKTPAYMVWPLLRTWLDIHLSLSQTSPGFDVWHDFLKTLNFSESVCQAKNRALDSFLDRIEILIESWTNTYGF